MLRCVSLEFRAMLNVRFRARPGGPGMTTIGRKAAGRSSVGIGGGRGVCLRALRLREKTSALEAACRWAWADVIQLQRKVQVIRVDKLGLTLRLRNDGVRKPDGVGNSGL